MKSFITALHFLTRLKIFRYTESNDHDFRRSIIFFPLIGLLIGVILYLLASASQLFLLQPFSSAVIILTAEILLTGGLHLDGLMDSCDALFSGRDREKKLEIMKDSHAGAMGVIGLITVLLWKLALLVELTEDIQLPLILLIMPVMGRWAMVFALTCFPYARSSGIGAMFLNDKKSNLLWASLYSLLFFFFLMPSGIYYLTLIPTFLAVLAVSLRINQEIKGLTGDTYGLINEVTEVFFLFFCLITSKL